MLSDGHDRFALKNRSVPIDRDQADQVGIGIAAILAAIDEVAARVDPPDQTTHFRTNLVFQIVAAVAPHAHPGFAQGRHVQCSSVVCYPSHGTNMVNAGPADYHSRKETMSGGSRFSAETRVRGTAEPVAGRSRTRKGATEI